MLRRLLLTAALALAIGACGASEEDPGPDDEVVEPDAGAAEEPDAAAGVEGDFMEQCDPALEDPCADGLVCFMFNSRGPHCTHDCVTDADCPAPSRGCNNMGVCKAP